MPAKAPNLALAAELGRLLEYSLLSCMPNARFSGRARRLLMTGERLFARAPLQPRVRRRALRPPLEVYTVGSSTLKHVAGFQYLLVRRLLRHIQHH